MSIFVSSSFILARNIKISFPVLFWKLTKKKNNHKKKKKTTMLVVWNHHCHPFLSATWTAEPRPAWDRSKCTCSVWPTPDKGFCSVRYWPFSGKEEWLPTNLFLLQHQPPTPVTFKQNWETAKQCQHTAPERGFLVLVSDTEIIPQERTSPRGSPQSELKGLDFYFFLHFPHEYTAIGQFPS